MKKRTGGIILIVAPIIGLPLILSLYAILTFVGTSLMNPSEGSMVMFRIFNVILGLLGLVCVVGIFVAIPLGIVLVVTSDKKKEEIVNETLTQVEEQK